MRRMDHADRIAILIQATPVKAELPKAPPAPRSKQRCAAHAYAAMVEAAR